jgi:competence protein ComEA
VIFVILFVFFVVPPAFAQEDRINVNTASAREFMRLPGIGPALAARLVEYRRKHGLFKRPQDIVVIRGMSAKRYRQIAHLIRI